MSCLAHTHTRSNPGGAFGASKMDSCSSPPEVVVEEQSKGNDGHPWQKLYVFGIGQDLENLYSDS